MSFVADYFYPVIKVTVFVGMVLWVLYITYWFFRKYFKKIRLFIKYDVLGYSYDEKIVNWCMKANNLGYSIEKVKKYLLLFNKHSPKKVEEILYIYSKIRNLKGGLNDKNEQRIRESNSQTFPEI